MLGGGEDAMKVTQTSVMGAHFEAKFYHMVGLFVNMIFTFAFIAGVHGRVC
jgi:hypothetical protein